MTVNIDVNESVKENSQEPEVKWEPVAQPSEKKGRDPYEDAPESVRKFHESYVNFWLRDKKNRLK